jgi:hypothetical protein
MNADIRRRVVVGKRARSYGRAHPDPSAGFATAQANLEGALDRADALGQQQRAGEIAERSANARRRKISSVLVHPILDHVVRVSAIASKELPELPRTFRLPKRDGSYLAYRTAAGAVLESARTHKDLLLRHGLVETLLDSLADGLAQLDHAVEEAEAGRRQHVGAVAEQEKVAVEIMQLVKAMNGLNRFRFANDAEKLAAWESASNLVIPEAGGTDVPAPEGGATPPGADGKSTVA